MSFLDCKTFSKTLIRTNCDVRFHFEAVFNELFLNPIFKWLKLQFNCTPPGLCRRQEIVVLLHVVYESLDQDRVCLSFYLSNLQALLEYWCTSSNSAPVSVKKYSMSKSGKLSLIYIARAELSLPPERPRYVFHFIFNHAMFPSSISFMNIATSCSLFFKREPNLLCKKILCQSGSFIKSLIRNRYVSNFALL